MTKILIVEDDASLTKVLEDKFTAERFQVLVAHNGQEGLEKALAEKPEMIILDILMPVMDGLTMLRKLRETEWGKTVPVLLLTNLGDATIDRDLVAAGHIDFLVKSNWRIADVVQKVKDTLR